MPQIVVILHLVMMKLMTKAVVIPLVIMMNTALVIPLLKTVVMIADFLSTHSDRVYI